nr:reverse transcriptase domain-containing protein [Tanacetum cinerariifolium]
MMASLLQISTASTSGSGSLLSNIVANQKGELKAITTRSGLVTDGPTVPTPPKSITQEVDERVEETYINPNLAEYTIKVPPPLVQKYKSPSQRNFIVHTRDSPLPNISPFLRTARALIDVHGEEMIPRDGDERLTLNMKHDTASYSNYPHRESVNLINIFNVSSEDCLEEFTDELAHITYPLDYDDNLQFDIESDLREIEFLLYQGKDSSLKDSIEQTDLANLDDYFVDPIPEMFTDEHAPDYSSPPRFDVYDDDFLEVESDANNFYDDPVDSKGEKIKESKLLIDELDLPCDFLPYFEYDSFNSQDFSRDDELPSINNEDKVFNLGILIHEKSVKIITRVVQEKKLAISYASLVFGDFDPSFYEPLVFKDVTKSMMLLLFSSENEVKVFKPGIYTFENVYSCFLPESSHPGYHVFKVNQIFISLMKIFLDQCGKNNPLLDVLLFHFYPLKYGGIWSSSSI